MDNLIAIAFLITWAVLTVREYKSWDGGEIFPAIIGGGIYACIASLVLWAFITVVYIALFGVPA